MGTDAVAVVIGVTTPIRVVANVVRLVPDEAERTLQAAGFRVARSGTGNSVLSTVPGPGEETAEGATVALTAPGVPAPTQRTTGAAAAPPAGPGPELRTVPDVIGERLEDAERSLDQQGFLTSVIIVNTTDSTESGRVLRQSPAGGQAADTAEPVEVVVGKTPGGD